MTVGRACLRLPPSAEGRSALSESKPEIDSAAHCKGAAIAQQSRDRPLATASRAGTDAAAVRRQGGSGGRPPAVEAAAEKR